MFSLVNYFPHNKNDSDRKKMTVLKMKKGTKKKAKVF